MFVDKAVVMVSAGDGGEGKVSFRHEKYIDRGGPDGGDGGDGGDVIVVGSNSENTLAKYRYEKRIKAPDGIGGEDRRKHGKSGEDLRVPLPVGTMITVDGQVIADLTYPGQEVIIARGGKGGFGNAHFVSSTRQAPRVAEKGESGDSFEAVFELKSIADVGVIGLPNAGKSTFLSVVSNARPEIANYPFTTLVPNLGVVQIDKENSLLVADIPGLIEGASQGKGLGDEFLRHVERTKVLLHLIDSYNEDISAAYKTIIGELKAYSTDLSKRPQIVALTKIEGLDEEIVADLLKQLKKAVPKGTKVMAISALNKTGVKELLYELLKISQAARKEEADNAPKDEIVIIKPVFDDLAWIVDKIGDNHYLVTGRKIERFASKTRFDNDFSMQRLRDIFKKMGIARELRRQGAKPDDKIQIGKNNVGTFEL